MIFFQYGIFVGVELESEVEKLNRELELIDESTVCSKCGTKVSKSINYCPECGGKVN